MAETLLNKMTYPDFDTKPYWDSFVGMVNQLDVAIFQAKNRAHAFLCGGGVLSWNTLGNTFAWTDDFKIPLVMSGFVVNGRYGPNAVTRSAAVQPGECLYIRLPTQITDNIVKNFEVGSIVSESDAIFVLAYNCENVLYVRNGTILA